MPVEIAHKAYWAIKNVNLDLEVAGKNRFCQINELDELRNYAYSNSEIYKERMKNLHDKYIKSNEFRVGDQVLLFNSRLRLFPGKLKSRWSGPFSVTHVFPHGAVEIKARNGIPFKVNGQWLRLYRGSIEDEEEEISLQTVNE